MGDGALPWLEQLEWYAADLLSRTHHHRVEKPTAMRLLAVLKKVITVRRVAVKGGLGWHEGNEIHLAPHLTGERLERTAQHELGHWYLTWRKMPDEVQDKCMAEFSLCWLAPAWAVAKKIKDHGGLIFALPEILATWGHCDETDGFPVQLVTRAAHLARAAVILWLGRTRMVIGGGPYEMNLRLDKAQEKRAVEQVQETGKPCYLGPIIAWPLRYGDVLAVVFVLEGAPSLRLQLLLVLRQVEHPNDAHRVRHSTTGVAVRVATRGDPAKASL